MLRYCVNLKAIRYESTSLNRIVADKSHRVIVALVFLYCNQQRGNQALVGAIPFCGEYPGPQFEDKFRSSNQMDGISIADGGKMADS